MRRGICVITQGHLATCPRMLKAAEACSAYGYATRVVSAAYIAWAEAGDEALRAGMSGGWRWSRVDWRRRHHPWKYCRTAMRGRWSRLASRALGPRRTPIAILKRAKERACLELERAVLEERVDLIYGGGNALATAQSAARRMGVPYALDLEDFHSGEGHDTREGRRANLLASAVEERVLHGAAFLTAGSDAIREAYERRYGLPVRTINNTFDLPSTPPAFEVPTTGPLRLYWFSQTIGPDRGLEDAILAVGRAGIEAQLSLRGRARSGYVESLERLAAREAPLLRIQVLPTAPPDEMVALCREHDVGLAIERPVSLNGELVLSNKALTYVLAGIALAITSTRGHAVLAADLGSAALAFEPGNVSKLATGLRQWSDDRDALRLAKTATWAAGAARWHWSHPAERGGLLECVASVLGPPPERSDRAPTA